MTKQINFEAFKGFPFTVKATGKGYFDFTNSYFKSQDSVINFTSDLKPYVLDNYGKVKYVAPAESSATIDSYASMTPNYKKLSENKSVMLPFRNEVYENVVYTIPNYTNSGCNVSDDNIATGFSTSNKIALDETFPSEISTLELIIKAQFNSSSGHSVLFGKEGSPESTITVRDSGGFKFNSYYGSWQTTSSPDIELNKWYWFKVIWNGTNLIGYLLEDNSYNLETLPETTSWIECWKYNTNIFLNSKFNFGYNSQSPGEYCKGSIDLANTKIIVNDKVFWDINSVVIKHQNCFGNLYNYVDNGSEKTLGCWFAENQKTFDKFLILTDLEKLSMEGFTTRWLKNITIPAHDVYDYSETVIPGGQYKSYTANGKVTVDSDLMVTNFGSSENYLSMDCRLPENSMNWEFVMKVNSDSYSSYTRFFVSDPVNSSGHFGIALGCDDSSRVWLFLSSDGSSYNITSATSGTKQLQVNKDYWIKLAFNGSRYVVSISEDGQNFEDDITVESSTPVFSPESPLEIGVHGSNCLSTNAKVYLKDTYLKVDDEMFWKIGYKIPIWTKK